MPELNKLTQNKTFTLNTLYLLYPNGNLSQKEKPVRALKKILSRFKCKKRIIYIDNSAKQGYSEKISENEYALSGDNSLWEFSGWQKGIDFTRKNNLASHAFLFANDMFLHNSFFHRRSVNQAALECAIVYNAIIGKQMYPPVSGQIMGNNLIPYVRTHLFMLSAKTMDALGSLISINRRSAERIFIPCYDPDICLFHKDAPLSQEIKEFIFSYITSIWHRKRPYEAKNFEALKSKAMSILNSLLLSIRIRQFGCPLISYGKTNLFLSRGASLSQIDKIWFTDAAYYQNSSTGSANGFWLKNMPFYRYLPKKRPTWENFVDILEGQTDLPTHL